MGWCSGTPIFDKVFKAVMKESGMDDGERFQILLTLADALEDQDWDCQDDSKYRKHPMFKRVMWTLHDDWEEAE